MKNNFISAVVGVVLVCASLGCGVSERAQKSISGTESNTNIVSSNKSITDRAMDSAIGEGKVGIPECDQVLDIMAEQANNPDDNFVTKAVKQTAMTTAREQIKKRLNASNRNTADTAKFCRDLAANLKTQPQDSNANKE